MEIKEGELVKCKLDGKDYVIIKIVGKGVVLKAKDGEKEIITGTDSLRIFYEKKGGS